MKKLLLILICLFVSFEVRSESDNLSGKKLLCIRVKKNFDKSEIEKKLYGYEFVSKLKGDDMQLSLNQNSFDFIVNTNGNLVFRYYLDLFNDMDSFDKDLLNYKTTLQHIEIIKDFTYKNFDGGLSRYSSSEKINRETLEFYRDQKCQIVEELNSYFEERLDKKIKYMKSKQKI